MIKTVQLQKKYKDTIAVHTADIEFLPGKVYGLIGPNGAGKSTLLKMIMGMVKPTSGFVEVDDKKTDRNTYQDLVYMSEEGTLFHNMTAMEHAMFFQDYYVHFNMEQFEKYATYFEVPLDKKVSKLSKGQYAKLETILGLCKGAKYMLMDEPFLGNDMYARRDLLKLLAGLMTEDTIVIIATHLIEELEQFIDIAICMKDGQIVEKYELEELRQQGETLVDKTKELFRYNENGVLELL